MLKTFIYVLKCPITKEVKYVGKTNNPKVKFSNHLNSSRDKNIHKRNWINKLKKLKLKPIFEIIDEVPITDWHYWEKFYIKKYLDSECILVNFTNGGDGLTFGNQTSFKKGQNNKPVIILNKDGSFLKEFASVSEANLGLGKKIDAVLYGNGKTAGGYIPILKDAFEKLTQEELSNIIEKANKKEMSEASKQTYFKKGHNKGGTSYNKGKFGSDSNHPRKRSIEKIDKDTFEILEEFCCISDAVRKYGTKSIEQALSGKNKTACGFIWRYKE